MNTFGYIYMHHSVLSGQDRIRTAFNLMVHFTGGVIGWGHMHAWGYSSKCCVDIKMLVDFGWPSCVAEQVKHSELVFHLCETWC